MRTCNSFQSHPVHRHFDRSKITNQVTNNNLRGMGLLLHSCLGISWMFFPILWGQFPCCSGYGTKWVLSICRMILTGKDFFIILSKIIILLWRIWPISVKRWKPVWICACLLCHLHCTNLHPKALQKVTMFTCTWPLSLRHCKKVTIFTCTCK